MDTPEVEGVRSEGTVVGEQGGWNIRLQNKECAKGINTVVGRKGGYI